MIDLNTLNKIIFIMNSFGILKRLGAKPVFRIQDIERIAFCNRKYAWLLLNRLVKRGLIKKIAENAYTLIDDVNVIASNLIFPSYISFWYASYFFGYTEQIVNTVQVASTVKKKLIRFEKYEIKFIPIKHFFGYKKISANNEYFFIAENEKLLIDAFLKPKEFGNFDEIVKVFENAEISEEKLVGYLRKINNQSVIKRVCFLLEKERGIVLSNYFKLNRNYVLLNPFSKKWKKTNSKWRIKL